MTGDRLAGQVVLITFRAAIPHFRPDGGLLLAAALAVHLMTDDARSITGSVFTIDGGRTAG